LVSILKYTGVLKWKQELWDLVLVNEEPSKKHKWNDQDRG
jgi:hypothetical protein